MATASGPIRRLGVNFGWISEAWQYVAAETGTWIGATLIAGTIGLAVSYGLLFGLGLNAVYAAKWAALGPRDVFNPFAAAWVWNTIPLYWLILFLDAVTNAFFFGGMTQIANAQVRGHPVNIGMLFKAAPTFPGCLAVSVCFRMVAFTGLKLYLIPGLILYALLLPAMALAADGEPIPDIFSKSVRAIVPNFLMAFLFICIAGLLLVLGSVLTCGIGALVLVPMSVIYSSLAYRDIIGMPAGEMPADPAFAAYRAGQQPGVWPPAPAQMQWGKVSPQEQLSASPQSRAENVISENEPRPSPAGESDAPDDPRV